MTRFSGAMFATLLSLATTGLAAAEAVQTSEGGEPVIVTVDRAKVFHVSRPAATVIIGNPAIADATVEDEQTLVLTGRSFGVTNLIILDAKGDPIVDQTLVVRGHETNTVRIYRRSQRETMACAPGLRADADDRRQFRCVQLCLRADHGAQHAFGRQAIIEIRLQGGPG